MDESFMDGSWEQKEDSGGEENGRINWVLQMPRLVLLLMLLCNVNASDVCKRC